MYGNFAVTHPRWEPYAGKPHVRIWAGGAMKIASLPLLRRAVITLLGGAAAWPIAARAQQSERVRRIGVLMSTSSDEPESQNNVTAFVQGLQETGWAIGRNLRIDHRWSGNDRAPRSRAPGSRRPRAAPTCRHRCHRRVLLGEPQYRVQTMNKFLG